MVGLQEVLNKLNKQCYRDFSKDITIYFVTISTRSLGFIFGEIMYTQK